MKNLFKLIRNKQLLFMSLFQVIFCKNFKNQQKTPYKTSEKGRMGCVKYDVLSCLYQYYQPPQPPREVGRRLLSHYQIHSSLKSELYYGTSTRVLYQCKYLWPRYHSRDRGEN